MRKLIKEIIATTAIVLLVASPNFAPAFAGDMSKPFGSNLMSYAPQPGFDEGRFGQFDFSYSEHEDEHELNDAWLGISVYSSEGKYVGYVEDAMLEANGAVKELVIGTPEGNTAVQLSSEYAELEGDKVNLEITEYEFASILTNGQVVSSLQ